MLLDVLSFIDHSLKQRRAVVMDLNGASPDLFKERITDGDVEVLVKTVSSQNGVQLAGIDVRNNSISSKGALILSELLQSPSPTGFKVYRLTLNGNEIDHVGAKAISSQIATNKCVRILELNSNPIGTEGAMAVVEALRSNSTLTSLDLGNTDIGVDVVISLCDLMTTTSKLKTLNLDAPLYRRKLSDVPVQHVGRMLRVNSSLQSISLCKHGIDDNGAEVLASYLMENNSLKHINLASNKIGYVGATAFARLLVKGSTIESIDVSANRIQSRGAMAFAAALAQDVRLVRLNCAGNEVDDQGLFALGESLRKNRNLRELSCWGNMFAQKSASSFHGYVSEYGANGVKLDFKPYVVDGKAMVACLGADRM
jgi:Ran GTPase-activating protein (RanGAP) involved in mRNA processing and transport